MDWLINTKRVVREAITAGYCDCERQREDADVGYPGFNSPLQEQTVLSTSTVSWGHGHEGRATEEDMEDISDAQAALAEQGERKVYEDFRRELGLD